MQAVIHIENQSSFELSSDEDPPSWISACLELPEIQTALNNKPVVFSILYASSDEAQSINTKFRSKNYPTNVLSFPAELPNFIQTLDDGFTLGDLVICPEIILKEALAQSKLPVHHHAHLVIHGFLHLLGFDHEQDADAAVMENLEILALQALAIPNPYTENNQRQTQNSHPEFGLQSTYTETT